MQPALLVVQKAVPEADPGDGQRRSPEVAFYNGENLEPAKTGLSCLSSPGCRSAALRTVVASTRRFHSSRFILHASRIVLSQGTGAILYQGTVELPSRA